MDQYKSKFQEDLLPGGQADDLPDSDFDLKDLVKGTEDEAEEHTTDERIAKEIAKDHLIKDPNYYNESYKSKFLEGAQTIMMQLASEFGKSPSIKEIFELYYTANSLIAQYSAKDGKTYQVEIKEVEDSPKSEAV